MKKNVMKVLSVLLIILGITACKNNKKEILENKIETEKIILQNNIVKITENNYYFSPYFDCLKFNNREYLKNYDHYSAVFEDSYWEEFDGTVHYKWYEPNIFLFDNIHSARNLEGEIEKDEFVIGRIWITVEKIEEKDNNLIVYFKPILMDEYSIGSYKSTLVDWKILNSTNSNTLVFIEDGDYLNIFYDKDKLIPFATFAKMNDETLEQFKSLIYTNKCDLSKVTWPRHADGSCDYEKGNTLVASSSSATNVSINKEMFAKENLKLRSGKATTSSVLTVMQAGTKVKILQLGKAETIDGINSNWVKVEVISGNDRDGNKMKSGMTGWCYGGYLQ